MTDDVVKYPVRVNPAFCLYTGVEMSQKGGQHGGAHYHTHAESSRPKPGLNPNLSVSSKPTQKVFQDCLVASTDSQLPNGNTTVNAFQDGDRGTESYTIEVVAEQHNNSTGRSPSVFSVSNSVLRRATKRQKRRSVDNTSVQSLRNNNIRNNRIVTTPKQNRKKLEQVNNKSNLIDPNCESSDISNNSIIVIERLNYLSSEPSSSDDDDDEEEVADGDDEAEHEIEDLHNYGEHSVAGSNGEWLKSRIRNLNSVVDFNLDQSHTDDQEVVDSLELGSTSKTAKDIVVDEFFADEHLAISPESGSVMPPLTGTEHVLVPSTTESIALYNNNNKHATDTEDIVTTSVTSPNRSHPTKISVTVDDIETGSTSGLPQITPPPDSSSTPTNTPSSTTTNVFLVDNSEEPCSSSSFPRLSSSSYSTTTTSNSSSLETSLLEFRRVGTDKSNTLMTPQELESMPDQGIEFEESVGPKQEVISPSSLTTCSTTSPSSSLSLSDSLSVLSDSPQSHQKLLNNSSLLESPSRTATPTPNNNDTNSITTDHSSNLDVKPIFIDSSGTSTSLTSSADNTSTTTAGLDSSIFNAGNFTLATISISTDRATNSTQILVNTNQGQQLYHINTADLTQPLSLPVTQAPPTTLSSSASTATRTTSVAAPLSTSSQTNGPSPQTGKHICSFIYVFIYLFTTVVIVSTFEVIV